MFSFKEEYYFRDLFFIVCFDFMYCREVALTLCLLIIFLKILGIDDICCFSIEYLFQMIAHLCCFLISLVFLGFYVFFIGAYTKWFTFYQEKDCLFLLLSGFTFLKY